MSGEFLLDWAALSISLFDTILLVWLGLTVLFNAEHHSWGVILAVSGLLAGSAFFVSHSVIVSRDAPALVQDFNFWWHVGWALVIAAPYAWYLLMLWYSGYWEDRDSSLHHRQKGWLWFSVVYTLVLVTLLVAANPLPGVSQDALLKIPILSGSVPIIILVYPPFILLCIGLALDALLRPAPSGRLMGDLARKRARPWLISGSLILLLVSALVGGSILWILRAGIQNVAITDLISTHSLILSILDLLLAGLLTAVVLLTGQAIMSYEIFTGKILPRRGFQRQWRYIILLAAAFSGLAAWGITRQVSQVYTILAILVLVAFSYAVFSRQSFTERERSIDELRPFIGSQRLFETILTTSPDTSAEVDLTLPFSSLCRDVLNTRVAALIPLGTVAALGGLPLYYPPGKLWQLPVLGELLSQLTSHEIPGLSLDPLQYSGAIWATPLWGEHGMNGLLFLGEKNDGGLYSLEEIEIARAGGERLVDIQASAIMARRLVMLQRQRMRESQVLDRQTHRILHDDVLPRLHAALLELSSVNFADRESPDQVIATLSDVHRQIADLLHNLPRATAPEITRLGLFEALRQTLEEELRGCFESVAWHISPEVTQREREIPLLSAEVAYYAAREAMRNAAQHANPSDPNGSLRLTIQADWKDGLEIVIEDNGVGLVQDRSKSGGQGLILHSTLMAVVGGSLALESAPGQQTRMILHLPDEVGNAA